MFVPAMSDAQGAASFSFPFFHITIPTQVFYAQAIHAAKQPSSALATTNRVSTALGSSGMINYIYNFNRDGPIAEGGPSFSNFGPILLLHPLCAVPWVTSELVFLRSSEVSCEKRDPDRNG